MSGVGFINPADLPSPKKEEKVLKILHIDFYTEMGKEIKNGNRLFIDWVIHQ